MLLQRGPASNMPTVPPLFFHAVCAIGALLATGTRDSNSKSLACLNEKSPALDIIKNTAKQTWTKRCCCRYMGAGYADVADMFNREITEQNCQVYKSSYNDDKKKFKFWGQGSTGSQSHPACCWWYDKFVLHPGINCPTPSYLEIGVAFGVLSPSADVDCPEQETDLVGNSPDHEVMVKNNIVLNHRIGKQVIAQAKNFIAPAEGTYVAEQVKKKLTHQ